jgi:GGDEF domain-containing protein
MSTVETYLSGRFPLLSKVTKVIRFLWPRLGAELEDLQNLSADLATDDLSGHHVRKLFYLRLQGLLAPIADMVLAGDVCMPIVLVLFDMAMLNFANKAGHDAGNNYIRRVSAALSRAEKELYLRGATLVFVGRLGGDEFGLVCVGLSKSVVDDVVKQAQEEVKKVDLEHLDAGSSELSDVHLVASQRGEHGEILVSSEPGRGTLRAVQRRLDLIADERANIAKATARIHLMAWLRAFASPQVYEEVLLFGMKAISDIEEMQIIGFAERMRAGEDPWLDILAVALDMRSKVAQGDPFRQAISLVAERDFRE